MRDGEGGRGTSGRRLAVSPPVDGILKLEEGGLRVTLIKAVVESARRAGELFDG